MEYHESPHVRSRRFGNGCTEPADYYRTFYYVNGNADRHLGTDILAHKGISEVPRAIFVGNTVPRSVHSRQCVVLNVDSPNEDKCDDTKTTFL